MLTGPLSSQDGGTKLVTLQVGNVSQGDSLAEHPELVDEKRLKVGAEKMGKYLSLLENKNIALLVNQTSTIGETHLVDTLLNRGIKIQKIFAPEHGFRGKADAGEVVKDGMDVKTGLPIISLYGKPWNG